MESPRPPAAPGAAAFSAPVRGTRLVLGLLALAAALAVFAVWFQWRQTRGCLAFYGVGHSRRIQSSPRVELWVLGPAAAAHPGHPDSETGAGSGTRANCGPPDHLDVRPWQRLDVSRAQGLVHLRRGLVEDANFAGEGVETGTSNQCWDAALAFFDAESAAVPDCVVLVAFSPPMVEGGPGPATRGMLAVVGRPAVLPLGRIEAGLRTWIDATVAAHVAGPGSPAPERVM